MAAVFGLSCPYQSGRRSTVLRVKYAGVLGQPIRHSLSPVLHRAAYAELGLDWSYDAYEVGEGELRNFVDARTPDWAGLSLTMPLKVEAVGLVDFIEPMAKLVGAVNTLIFQWPAGTRQLVGANTDVYGIVRAFTEAGVESAQSGVIVGGGATATSALAALGQLGVHRPYIAVRSRARAGGLMRASSKMGLEPQFVGLEDLPHVLGNVDVVVSTIPAEAGEQLVSSLPQVRGALLDVIYSPLIPPLAATWTERGGLRIGGERMLLHQASEQVRLMTGLQAPVESMHTALMLSLS